MITKNGILSPEIILPIGISFFTFQQIAFQVDSYYNKADNPTFTEYVFFVTFFPQLIAGPIVHHSEIFSQINNKPSFLNNFAVGLSIFSIGLFKKIIVADNIALTASSVFLSVKNGMTPNFIEAWFGALAYTLQIYFDFSAYSDMAIGLALVFGFKLPQNFASPYQSTSITEFWRRWHITLSRFIKDYFYIPMGGNRKGNHRTALNVLIVMSVAGLWHGASINFIFWGFLHGLFLVIQNQFSHLREKFGFNHMPDFWAWLITITCIVFAWVPFRANSWGDIFTIWKSMLAVNEIKLPTGTNIMGIPTADFLNHVDYQQGALIFIFILVAIFMPNVRDIFEDFPHSLSSSQYFSKSRSFIVIRWKPTWLWALLVSLLFLISLSNLSVYSEFLYFQF